MDIEELAAMQVFILDSDDDRKTSLSEQLAKKGVSVFAINESNQDSFAKTIQEADIIVIRDCSYVAVNMLLNQSLIIKSRIIITNMAEAQQYFGANYRVMLIHDAISEMELVENINAGYMGHDDQYFLPIVEDPVSKMTLELARKAAKTKATVLLSGETGVGKEILARFIHSHSPCFKGPFISVNCAAIPENMMEAILFGYEKGAFTNAINSYVGKFEQAQNGTLFLDEVSEIPFGLQAKLLRALQEREIEKLCGKKSFQINARIVVATNRDLSELVASGLFRKDLYYRLNVFPIHCAPFRDRSLDIIPLAEYFVRKYAVMQHGSQPMLSEQAKRKLSQYSWPGNIREMDNIIQRALIMSENTIIDAEDIDILELKDILNPRHDLADELDKLNSKIKENEAKIIMDVLKETDGCRGDAAKKLNMSPRTLRYKISKLKSIGLKVP